MIQKLKKASKKYSKKIFKYALRLADKALSFLLAISLLLLSMPHITLAANFDVPSSPKLPYLTGKQEILSIHAEDQLVKLPKTDELKEPRYVIKVSLSAYNSLPNQTDSSPCITASGLNVCERNAEDIIATNYNYLPFGTKVRFPEIFGDKIFIVHDRMNKRYTNNADIWMKDYQTAKKFGRKWTTMEIF